MSALPKVSVVIPCYNYARYLPEAVESALGQTFADLEVVIVDDGSTDDTAVVAERLILEDSDREVRLICQQNAGVSAARNRGIDAALGEYVLTLDADDVIRPTYVERLFHVLDADPGIDLAYTWTERFGDSSGVDESGEFTLNNLVVNNGPPCTILMRKSAWESVGGYNPVMDKGGEDWEFGLKLYREGYKAVVIPEALFMYRKHGTSRIDQEQLFALDVTKTLKLLHPWAFEPFLFGISPKLARFAIHLKRFTRDPVAKLIYLRLPRLHDLLKRLKYRLYR
jgi:glycosyltransferase involved in cell wall biosynthesis